MQQQSDNSGYPLVAIFTPVYNGGTYLGETMACVQAQTYPNLVHVVLDNASTDDTAEIIARYEGGPVKIITARNEEVLKQYPNWNACLAMIPPEAKYFRLLCADDTITPGSIAKMVELAETDDEIMLVTCQHWHDGEIDNDQLNPDETVFDGIEIGRGFLTHKHYALWVTHMLMRASLIEKRGEPFFWSDRIYGDTDVGLALLPHGKLGFIHEPLAMTRVHDEAVTAQVSGPGQVVTAEWLDHLERHGPSFFNTQELDAIRRDYLNFYYRRLLRWRFVNGAQDLYRKHHASLESKGLAPGIGDYARAVFLKLRDKLTGRSGKPSPAFADPHLHG